MRKDTQPDEFEDFAEKIRQNDPAILANEWGRQAVLGAVRKRIGLNDEIPFDGVKCITECGGKCCTGIEVIVKPYDVYRIVTSPEGKKLGFSDTTKLFSGVNAPFECYLGPTSGLPIARIKFITGNGKESVCPFLIPVQAPRSKQELRKMIKKRGVRRSRTIDGSRVMLCRLHKVKPLICRASPIGRSQIITAEGIKTSYHFRPPMEDCVGVQTDKRVKVADYIQEWALDEYYAESEKFHAILPKLLNPPLNLRKFLLVLLYDFDWAVVGAGIDPATVRPSYDELLAMTHQVIDNWGKNPEKVRAIAQQIRVTIDLPP